MDSQAIQELKNIVGHGNVQVDTGRLREKLSNTLGLERQIMGVVYPGSTEEVRQVVGIANSYRIPLYPISRGKNIGYGEKLPVRDGQLIVNLRRMNKIKEFDDRLGYVVLETGVTQKQLFEYLKERESSFRTDATGAGLEASIVGNTLEGGFGHTPRGNHREEVSDIEVVLGNGTVLRTGSFPGIGPDLSGAFVQSNFGIVTSMKVELMPIPEKFESFLIKIRHDCGLEPLVEALRSLRQQGILTSLVHITNATRSVMSTRRCPAEYATKVLRCEDAQTLMSSPVFKIGYWSAIGGVYGSPKEVRARKKAIKRALQAIGDVIFFSDAKINSLAKIGNSFPLKGTGAGAAIAKSMQTYRHVHGLMQGIPSDEPLKNIRWRVDDYNDMGLIWYSPTVAARRDDVRKIVNLSQPLFTKYGFEMPLTLTLVTPNQVVGILSISFNRNNPEEKERAYSLYRSLKKEFDDNDIQPYRTGILGMRDVTYTQEGKNEIFAQLKRAWDPNNIIAPGRYGI